MGEKKNADERGPVRFWLSERDDICLARVLIEQVKADSRSERRQKTAVLEALDLKWFEEAMEGPGTDIKGSDLAAVYDREIAAGHPRDNAFVAVAIHAFNVDRFAGRRSRTVNRRKELSRELCAWLLDKIERIDAGGVNDLLLSRIETRLSDAKHGDLRNWPADLAEAEAVPEDTEAEQA